MPKFFSFFSLMAYKLLDEYHISKTGFVSLMQTPFGYTRKDVLLIGLGVTVAGIALKSGLEVFIFLMAFTTQEFLLCPFSLSLSTCFHLIDSNSGRCKLFLQLVGVDPLQAGNVVQLVLVLGLTVGWISTYIFRVSNKEMTYAQQLRDYESKVMEVCSLTKPKFPNSW